MNATTLLIFGAKSTALEISDLASLLHPEWRVLHVVGEAAEGNDESVVRLSQLDKILSDSGSEIFGIISMANSDLRMERERLMHENGIKPVSLIHPDTSISKTARIGSGCYIAAGCRISVNAVIGDHSIVNLNATIGHDAVCGKHAVINPGAAISGNVTIGERVLVGANSFIFQGLEVGDDAQIDAMTYVSRSLPAMHVATSRNLKVYPRRK